MVKLRREESIRIKRSGKTRITCVAGVAWVTNQGDLRDFILSPGECLEVARGLTVITALDPTVVKVEKTSGVSLIQELSHSVRATTAGLWQCIRRFARRSDLTARTAPLPYY
jgi:hypothetical protein